MPLSPFGKALSASLSCLSNRKFLYLQGYSKDDMEPTDLLSRTLEMAEPTRLFIAHHATDNVNELALHASRHPDVDMPVALMQIEGRQKMAGKLADMSLPEGFLFPPRLSLEQCSSSFTATRKQHIVQQLLQQSPSVGQPTRFADLTGGFGIDFMHLAPLFGEALYVERNPVLCGLARHNFGLMGLSGARVECADGTESLLRLPHVTLLYLDPARRDMHGRKVFGIEDCSPDVAELADELVDKASWVLLKLSPMLDWHEALRRLRHAVRLYILSVGNECKELLVLMRKGGGPSITVCCENSADEPFMFSFSNPAMAPSVQSAEPSGVLPMAPSPAEGCYLYEPNASIMKAGCFALLARTYQVAALAANSHLFVSNRLQRRFPGRTFRITAVSTFNKHSLRRMLEPLSQANIAVRNFPMTVQALRKRLKLREGGHVYLFATTLQDGTRLLLQCAKV